MNYLEKIKQLEQEAPRTATDWLAAWRELAQLTYAIEQGDTRFEPVTHWINVCDLAFSLGSWDAFCEAAEEVKRKAREIL